MKKIVERTDVNKEAASCCCKTKTKELNFDFLYLFQMALKIDHFFLSVTNEVSLQQLKL